MGFQPGDAMLTRVVSHWLDLQFEVLCANRLFIKLGINLSVYKHNETSLFLLLYI